MNSVADRQLGREQDASDARGFGSVDSGAAALVAHGSDGEAN